MAFQGLHAWKFVHVFVGVEVGHGAVEVERGGATLEPEDPCELMAGLAPELEADDRAIVLELGGRAVGEPDPVRSHFDNISQAINLHSAGMDPRGTAAGEAAARTGDGERRRCRNLCEQLMTHGRGVYGSETEGSANQRASRTSTISTREIRKSARNTHGRVISRGHFRRRECRRRKTSCGTSTCRRRLFETKPVANAAGTPLSEPAGALR